LAANPLEQSFFGRLRDTLLDSALFLLQDRSREKPKDSGGERRPGGPKINGIGALESRVAQLRQLDRRAEEQRPRRLVWVWRSLKKTEAAAQRGPSPKAWGSWIGGSASSRPGSLVVVGASKGGSRPSSAALSTTPPPPPPEPRGKNGVQIAVPCAKPAFRAFIRRRITRLVGVAEQPQSRFRAEVRFFFEAQKTRNCKNTKKFKSRGTS
jgi:hypothetical protein